jgi:hypothetical protein
MRYELEAKQPWPTGGILKSFPFPIAVYGWRSMMGNRPMSRGFTYPILAARLVHCFETS